MKRYTTIGISSGKRVITGQKDGSFKLLQLVNAIPAVTVTATPAATVSATVTLAPTSAAIAKPLKLNLKYRTKPGVGHSQDIKAVTYSPDGKLLASTDGLTLQLWEAATQKPVANWDSHGANSLSFSPDGKWLAGGGFEKTATIWETATGKELVTLKGHTHTIRRVAFSPDGKMLATSGGDITAKDDNTVRLWDTTTGKELFVLKGHTSLIDGLAFSPDGKMLVTGDWDSKIFLWDPHTGQRLATPVINFPRPLALAFSPDGKWLAGSSFAGLLTVWDMTTSRQAYKLAGHTGDIRTLAFSADSRWLASGDGNTNGTIRLWDLEDGGKLVTTLPSHTSIVHTVAFSPDGKTLASGGGAGTAQENDNAIKLWEIPTGKDLGLIKGVENDLYALFIHPDGQSFFSLGMDGVLKRRELVSGKELFSISLGYLGDGSVAFSPDGKLVALAGRNEKVIYLYELASGKRVNIFAGQIGSIGLFRFSPDSRTLVSVSNNGGNILKFWDVASGQELLTLECPPNYSPGGLVFSQDGKTLASGGITYGKGTMGGTVKLWETATGKELASFEAGPKYNSVVGFTPDGKTLISVMDTSLIFWDVAAGQAYRRINSSNDKNYWAVKLSNDGRLLAARAGKELKVWDVASGSEVYTSTLSGDLSSLYFTPDDKMLLAAFADGSLSLWEITS